VFLCYLWQWSVKHPCLNIFVLPFYSSVPKTHCRKTHQMQATLCKIVSVVEVVMLHKVFCSWTWWDSYRSLNKAGWKPRTRVLCQTILCILVQQSKPPTKTQCVGRGPGAIRCMSFGCSSCSTFLRAGGVLPCCPPVLYNVPSPLHFFILRPKLG